MTRVLQNIHSPHTFGKHGIPEMTVKLFFVESNMLQSPHLSKSELKVTNQKSKEILYRCGNFIRLNDKKTATPLYR